MNQLTARSDEKAESKMISDGIAR